MWLFLTRSSLAFWQWTLDKNLTFAAEHAGRRQRPLALRPSNRYSPLNRFINLRLEFIPT